MDLFGSKEAQKIFLMPYLIIVSVQGGVLDEIEHGSKVMYAVEPFKSLRPLSFLNFFEIFNSINLCMISPKVSMITFANNLIIFYDNATNFRFHGYRLNL